jgi:hypothetical protein
MEGFLWSDEGSEHVDAAQRDFSGYTREDVIRLPP